MAHEKTHRSMTGHAMGMIGLLTFQYLLGEFTSAFIEIPKNESNEAVWSFVWHHAPLALHMLIGSLLLLGTIALFIHALIAKNTQWVITSATAGIAIIAAAIAGATFVPTQQEDFSFFMAIFFLLALFSYFWGLYQTKGQELLYESK